MKHSKDIQKAMRDAEKEMAKPHGPVGKNRGAASAERPSATMPVPVDKIMRPRKKPVKAQIFIAGADKQYRAIRIENTLTDEGGNDLSLKKTARVDVTVTTKEVNWRR